MLDYHIRLAMALKVSSKTSSPSSVVLDNMNPLPGKPNGLSFTEHILPVSGSAPLWKYCLTILALQSEGVESDMCYFTLNPIHEKVLDVERLTPSDSCCKSLEPSKLLLIFCPLAFN
jgi:hypothetical protein